ncbi:MAG: hypothetical protein M0R51_09250 [Clostridia bacterium]|jgi:hypothetical protein|nr:hypothetical protein [Clostridia bacterium]
MSIINRIFGKKSETYVHKPAECEYYVLCECQYGTQSCSMIREDCLKCTRRQSYIDENAGTDIKTGRIEMYTKEGQNNLYGGKYNEELK